MKTKTHSKTPILTKQFQLTDIPRRYDNNSYSLQRERDNTFQGERTNTYAPLRRYTESYPPSNVRDQTMRQEGINSYQATYNFNRRPGPQNYFRSPHYSRDSYANNRWNQFKPIHRQFFGSVTAFCNQIIAHHENGSSMDTKELSITAKIKAMTKLTTEIKFNPTTTRMKTFAIKYAKIPSPVLYMHPLELNRKLHQ